MDQAADRTDGLTTDCDCFGQHVTDAGNVHVHSDGIDTVVAADAEGGRCCGNTFTIPQGDRTTDRGHGVGDGQADARGATSDYDAG
jgi:hypothetical protein